MAAPRAPPFSPPRDATWQLTFFSTEMDVLATNDLGTAILSAILSDCDRTVDAINLAVRWRDPEIIKGQLDESQVTAQPSPSP